MYKSYSMELAGRTLTVDVGRVAAQEKSRVDVTREKEKHPSMRF